MKNLLVSLAAITIITTPIFGLEFLTNVTAPDEATLTKTKWVSSVNNPVNLKGKPTKNDSVVFRCYEGDFIIDANLDARSIGFYEQAFVVAENKKINSLKGGLTFVISSNPNHTNQLYLKKSEMNVNGSVAHSPTSGNKNIGQNVIKLEDSKFSATGNMDFTITSSIFTPTEGRSGVKLELLGNSIFKLKGDLLIDSLLEENRKLMFIMSFEDRNGVMPKIAVNKGVIGGSEIRIMINNLKKGKYPIFESIGRKPIEGLPRKISINGKDVKLNQPITLNNSNITLILDSNDPRSKIKNDLVLIVE